MHSFWQWYQRFFSSSSTSYSNVISVNTKRKFFNFGFKKKNKTPFFYEEDYLLTPIGEQFLFYEYLEMSNFY